MINRTKGKLLGALGLLMVALVPLAASAQALPPPPNANTGGVVSFIDQIRDILELLLPILVTLAVLAFFWGLVRFIWGAGDSRDAGKQIMLWGIIALFVIVSIWGIVGFIANLFGIGTGGSAPVPQVNDTPGVGGTGNNSGPGGNSSISPPNIPGTIGT